jgi:uncharacterized protein (DUF983 family)
MQHAASPAGGAEPIVWTPKTHPVSKPYGEATLSAMLRRGLLCRCPSCGATRLFVPGLLRNFLRVTPVCVVCQAPLGAVRADDAPPYFTIFIVAHLMIGLLIAAERVAMLSVAAELAIFVPLTLALTLALMRPVKGATIALMLKLGLAATDEDSGHGGHA